MSGPTQPLGVRLSTNVTVESNDYLKHLQKQIIKLRSLYESRFLRWRRSCPCPRQVSVSGKQRYSYTYS